MSESVAVYCGNCKWCRVWGRGTWNGSCALHEVHYVTHFGDKMVRTQNSLCRDRNKDCDCKNYERKPWWKVWR